MDGPINKAIGIIKSAQSIFVLTGAGISAESGIPTFRGTDGLWKNYSVTDLATPEAFARNPRLVWEWYQWRQDIINQAEPNPAHYAVAELEKITHNFLLLTQNVDNLHQRAGSKNVLHLHGSIFSARCIDCGNKILYNSKEDYAKSALPRCACGGLLRPDVVWFGEPIPQDIWHSALNFLNDADLALICGTSGVVWPAAAIPEIAGQSGTATIEINLEPTPLTNIVNVSLHGKAGELLPRIIQNLSD
jgi:NAD-dependent deacetylase